MIERASVRAWFGAGGEAYLQVLRVMKRRYVSLTLMRLDAAKCQAGWDAMGNAQRVSLAKMVLYYNTHLAAAINSGCNRQAS